MCLAHHAAFSLPCNLHAVSCLSEHNVARVLPCRMCGIASRDMADDSGRPFDGLRVLAISPTPTHPTTAGNRVRFRALLDRLQDLGATVRLVHIAHEPGDSVAMQAHWTSGGATVLPFQFPPPRHARWNRFAERCRRIVGLPVPDRADVDDWYDRATGPRIAEEVADRKSVV